MHATGAYNSGYSNESHWKFPRATTLFLNRTSNPLELRFSLTIITDGWGRTRWVGVLTFSVPLRWIFCRSWLMNSSNCCLSGLARPHLSAGSSLVVIASGMAAVLSCTRWCSRRLYGGPSLLLSVSFSSASVMVVGGLTSKIFSVSFWFGGNCSSATMSSPLYSGDSVSLDVLGWAA